MTVPKRFALRTLMLLMLVVASVFGYAQWRRQWLRAEITRLNRESDPLLGGRTLSLNDGWFWPTVPEYCSAVIRKERHGMWFADGREMNAAEAKAYLTNKADRLYGIGVKRVVYGLLITDNRPIPPEVRVTMLKDLSELMSE